MASLLCWYGGAAHVARLQAAAVPAGPRRGTQRAAGSSPNRGPHSYRAHSTGPRGPPKSYFYLVVAQPPFSFARCFSDMVDRLPAITVAAAAPRAPIGLHHQCHSPVQSPPSFEGPVMATPTVAQTPVGCEFGTTAAAGKKHNKKHALREYIVMCRPGKNTLYT